jgi:multidrug resistance efflux pump
MKGTGFKSFRFGRLRVHILPVLVWLAGVACVVVLLHRQTERFEVLGLAQGRVHQASANCAGRLKEIQVELFENVREGQALAVIDTVADNENLEAQLSTARAEVQHIKAELAAAAEQYRAEAVNQQTDWIEAQRRFAVDVESARIRILELKTQLEEERMILTDLGMEMKIVGELLEEDAVAAYALQKIELQYNGLAKKIEEGENLLKQATEDFLKAQQRRQEFAGRHPEHPAPDAAMEVIEKAVTVQEKVVEELLAMREPVVLRSPFDGVVSQIWSRAGDAVIAGVPIVIVAEATPREVVAYASDEQLARVRQDMRVELIKAGKPIQIAASQVVELGPSIELIPERLWVNPNVPEWGRPILIKIPPDLKLIPGELVGIKGL